MDPLRRPLANALDAEMRRIELFIARIWVLLAMAGTLGAIVVAVTVDSKLGVTMAIMAGVAGAFFALVMRRLQKAPLRKRTSAVVAAVEGVLFCAFFVALAALKGAPYALSSWIPPMLAASLIVAWITRLEPRATLLVSCSAALTYLIVYFVYVRPMVPTGPQHTMLQDPPMQFSRAITIVIGGALGAAIAGELRRAIGRVDATLRREELLGKYRVVREIGVGSTGSVFEAIDFREGGFERRVAVKRLHSSHAGDPAVVARVRAEAEIGARLTHPDVLAIYDFGRDGETFFTVTELAVSALSLATFMARARRLNGPVSVAIVAHVGASALRALEHAHEGLRDEAGKTIVVLHRNIGPESILVSRAGDVKLRGFVAAAVKMRAGHEAYMAPERVEGRGHDVASDLFGLAVVLFELLVGQSLFVREDAAATLNAISTAPIPLVTSLRPDVDPAWSTFFGRVLDRQPERRFRSAREMRTALEHLSSDPRARAMLGDAVAQLTTRSP
jgi:hypothetical protein